MLFLTAAMILTLFIGFLAGKEYDRGVRKARYNRRLRRERAEQMRKEAEANRIRQEEKAKFDFIYGVQMSAPRR